MQTEKPPGPELKVQIEPDRLDLSSIKVQMSIGALLIFFTCLVSYWTSLQTGFLLDDFLHLDYVARAAGGDWQDFLSNFWSNWAGSDIMKSYRPVVSASLLLDYLFWRTSAFGFHLTNIVLTASSAILLSLITLEITGLYGNRLGASAAVWAGLLFAVYPLHPEAVSWIIGRVDLLCTACFLASFLCYLRFRRLKESSYLTGALILFAVSLLSKEMAVTFPLIVTAAEFLLPLKKTGLKNRLVWVGSFWVLLAFIAAGRTILLGTLIGGYGSSNILDMAARLKIFADKATILKILYPANEEVMHHDWLRSLIFTCYGAGSLFFISRLLTGKTSVRPVLFLILAMAILVLPAFQIWHIHPNLVGSRLFYLASAPFCMLIALSCLPAADMMTRKTAMLTSAAGTLLLISIFLCWYGLLEGNLKPWTRAGLLMNSLGKQVRKIANETAPGKAALLLNLPTDYSGAGMLTRPQYLSLIAAPPFTEVDLSGRLLTIEPVVSGNHDFMWPGKFKRMVEDSEVSSIWIWKNDQFEPWEAPSAKSRFFFKTDEQSLQALSFEPGDINLVTGNEWHLETEGKPTVSARGNSLEVNPGPTGLTLIFPKTDINPVKASLASVQLELKTSRGCKNCSTERIKLLWASDAAPSSSAVPAAGFTGQASLRNHKDGSANIWLGRYRSWTLNGKVSRLALKFEPGQYSVRLSGLTIGPDTAFVPGIKVSGTTGASGPRQLWMQQYAPASRLSLEYDASDIPGAERTRVIATRSGITFDSSTEGQLETANAPSTSPGLKTLAMDITESGRSGTIALPEDLVSAEGVCQVRVQPLTGTGLPAGFPSEPVTIEIRKE